MTPVAVFVQPGMVNYGGAPAVGNERLTQVLSSHGFAATPLDAAQLADPTVFNASRYAVLVMPYGNAFPLPAFDNLRRFHAAGGCMVLTGIPFCHPCQPSAPAGWFARWGDEAQWLEEGHRGGRAVRVIHKTRDFQECTTSQRWKVKPGEKLQVSAWVRSKSNQPNKDYLFVRFFSAGAFVSQEGPAVPVGATTWQRIQKTVTVPSAATEADVSLQVWSPGATVDLDDVTFTRASSRKNLAPNPGFEQAGGEWQDLGHREYFDHSPKGMGTGSFGGPAEDEGALEVPSGNVLGFRKDLLARTSARLQWLDETSLPPEDEVLPVVQLSLPGGEKHFLAGAIRHNCKAFNGARDVWVGQVASAYTPDDRHCADQLILRGTAWCLKEKGRMREEQYRAFLKRLDAEPRPKPMPDNIE
ncbi:MAG: hypothetical protein J7M26_09215, partial [Armatimonadetes bacterium]|nr:hypothetical protein [Armatimonadota bacterium]